MILASVLSVRTITLAAASFAAITAQPGGNHNAVSPVYGASPATLSLVVLNKADSTATIWDLPSETAAAPLKTGQGPHEIVPLGKGKVLVSNYGDIKPGSTLSIIDTRKRGEDRVIDLGDYRRPHGLWMLPTGKILVTAEVNESLIEVDLATGKVLRSWITGQKATHMVVATRDGTKAFTANISSGTVTIVDLTKEGDAAVKHIATGAGAEGITISPDDKEVWVANNRADTISVIDVATGTVAETIPAKSFALRVLFTPDGSKVLMSSTKTGELVEFDAKSRKETRRLSLMPTNPADFDALPADGDMKGSPMPIGMIISPDGSRAFIANSSIGSVAEVDLSVWKVISHRRTGKGPDGIMLIPK